MMLEQTLVDPHFIGRDGFKWFLGLVAKGGVDQYNQNGTRARVRILGYHGDQIADSDLPWAHVLVPLTMGSGTHGAMMQGHIKESSLVVGFFADGDDGQQPIIIGAFYNGSETEFPAKFADGSKKFKLFQPETSPLNPYNKPVSSQTRASVTQTGSNKSATSGNGVVDPAGKAAAVDGSMKPSATTETLDQSPIVNRPGHCKDAGTGFGKILQGLTNLIKTLNTVNQVANGFVNPILNTISNIDDEIRLIGVLITDWISDKIKLARDFLINEIYNKLKLLLDQIKLPSWAEKLKQAAVGELTDGIWCAIGKILKKITSYVTNFLFGLIGNVVSLPLCAAEAFIGSIIQTITNEIADALGSILDQASSIVGPIGTVLSYVNKAIGYAKGALNFLLCDDNPCKEVYDYEMNVGFIPKGSIENFQKAISFSPSQGVSNLLSDADGNVSKFLGGFEGGLDPALAEAGSLIAGCNVFSFECGPPKVSIFGGGGSGATGNAVVDSLGGILGVNITNPGYGYVEPPYVRFEDPCNNGRGAYGIANIGKVKRSGIGSTSGSDGSGTGIFGTGESGIGNTTIGITDVVMYYPGSGYLGPSTSTNPCKTNPFDESGLAVTGTISRVIIENTGLGYKSTDKIYDAACDNNVEIYPITDDDGRIIDIDIVNPGDSINITPNLQINSDTGSGAILIPALIFKQISGISTVTDPKTVIYCAEDP
jgi:hypothetical protein